jgi:hypothetical protein
MGRQHLMLALMRQKANHAPADRCHVDRPATQSMKPQLAAVRSLPGIIQVKDE